MTVQRRMSIPSSIPLHLHLHLPAWSATRLINSMSAGSRSDFGYGGGVSFEEVIFSDIQDVIIDLVPTTARGSGRHGHDRGDDRGYGFADSLAIQAGTGADELRIEAGEIVAENAQTVITFNGGDGDDTLAVFGVAAADVPVLGDGASGTVTPDGGGVINYTGVEAVRTPLIYQAPGAAELTLSFNETDDELDLFDAEEESVLASATNKAISSISEVRIIGSSEADALTLNASFNRPVWFDGGSGSVADMLLGPDEDNAWESRVRMRDTLQQPR